MANHALPQTTSTYANFVTELDARLDDLALGLDPLNTTATNLITNSIRWDSATNNWQKYNGTSWAALTAAYAININGTVGATTPLQGAFTTLSSSGVASLGASSTVGTVPIVTTTGSQTLTNKILTAPTISSITNTGTLTLPTATTTLVGTGTTDTLTNKTLTTPRIATADFIADGNGLAYLRFVQTATAVNQLTVTNSATAVAPSLAATGSDANISLNIQSKGTGVVQANGLDIVTTTGTQTLTNKTLTAPVISSISNTGTLTLPTATTTLVGTGTTDTLSNKTLTAPRFASAGFIADANGAKLLEFTTVASAVNHLVLANSAGVGDITLSTVGTAADINLDIICKGTGTLEVDGVPVATTTATQTLTNKSLQDSTTFFIDETDATKKLQFQLSGLTTATTVTLTAPTASTTLFGTDTTVSLTNKTLSTGCTWSGNTISIGGGGTGTGTAPTQGGAIYAASTTAYASTAAGTLYQVLQSNGTAAPTWTSLDLELHLPNSSYKKICRAATVANLNASTLVGNVLTGYSNTLSLALSTTVASNVVTTTTTAGIKVGAVISGNDVNITAGTTVSSITNATTFVISANALLTSTSITTTFTQTIAALSFDGITLAANDRVLVKDESTLGGLGSSTAARTNGIYTVTAAGSTVAPWILTRTADADANTDIDAALVNIAEGTTNGGRSFKTTFKVTDTLNTTPMYWNRLADVAASGFLGTPVTTEGIDLYSETKTLTFNTGNVANLAVNSFGIKTVAALAASIYTTAATVYIAGAPAASTNATITTPYALQVAAGNTLLGGNLTVSGGTITAGNVTTALLGGNTTTNINIGAGLTTGTFTLGAAGSTGTVDLFPATGAQAITLGGATTGTVTIGSTLATAVQLPTGKTKVGQTFLIQGVAGNITLPATAGTLVGSGDTGTVTNAMLAGSIANAKLTNSSITVGTTAISLGSSSTTLAGLTSVTSSGFSGPLTGNVTGNCSGSSGSCTGNAATATSAGSITSQANSATITAATTATASQIALRDASADITCRLIREEFADQTTISGGLVYRVNNTTDNYLRVCSDEPAIRTYLDVPTRTGGNASGSWGISVTGSSASCTGAAASATTAGTCTMAAARTDTTAYPVVWGTTGATSQLYSCTAVNIQSSTGTLTATNLVIPINAAGKLTINNTGGTATNPTIALKTSNGVQLMGGIYAVLGYIDNFIALSSGSQAFTFSDGGTFTAPGMIISYSDARLKTNLKLIDNAVAKVKQLNGYTFDRTDIVTPRQTGVIAQEVLQVLPEAVRGTEDTNYSVAYGTMVGLLIEAIKEQQQQIDELKSLVANLVGDNK